MELERAKHPSYGQLSITRVNSSHHQTLYGSPIKHDSFISMRLHESEVYRENGVERHHAGTCLVEVNMSEAQFAQLITTLNIGGGTPVTISRIDGKNIDRPPARNERAKTSGDMKKAAALAVRDVQSVINKMNDVDIIRKTAIKELTRELTNAIGQMTSAAPFLVGIFEETLDKVTTAAKADFDAFVTRRLQETGLNALGITATPAPEQLQIEGKSFEDRLAQDN